MNMSFVNPYVQMTSNRFSWHSKATYPKHLPLEFLVGHVLVGVNPCGRCIVVAPPPQIAKLSQKLQNNVSNTYELIWINIWPSFFIWRWFEWRLEQKINCNLICKLLPLERILGSKIGYVHGTRCLDHILAYAKLAWPTHPNITSLRTNFW